MPELEQLLETHGLTRLAETVKSIPQPSLRLIATEPTEAALSRLGGQPNLPTEAEWPTMEDWPLAFIAQIDLATLPEIPGLLLPRSGTLHFFYDGEDGGYDPKNKDACRVLYSPQPLASLPLHPFPEDDLEYRFVGVGLQPEAIEQTIPDLEDATMATLDLSIDERGAYFDLTIDWEESHPSVLHRMGGFPDCIQGDPKLGAQLVSHDLYCGDQTGWKIGKERGLFPGAAEWLLLLQVDSEEAAEMMWGDGGRLYYLIKKDDLAALRFDQTRLVLQCS